MRACDRLSVRLGYQLCPTCYVIDHPRYHRIEGRVDCIYPQVPVLSVGPSECKCTSGRDADGRHPRSESVAFGLSMNGYYTIHYSEITHPVNFFFNIVYLQLEISFRERVKLALQSTLK